MTESHNATRRRLSAGAAWTGARAHLRAHRACHANAAGDASPLQQPVKDFAVGTLGTATQVAVDACFRFFIGKVAALTLNLRG